MVLAGAGAVFVVVMLVFGAVWQRRIHELMGLDRFEMHAAHVDHPKTMKSIELFATEVAPLVREAVGS